MIIFTVIGIVVSVYCLLQLLHFLYFFFLAKPNLSAYGPKAGNWALVTGASDGIGKGFVEELARAGFNVALVSRTEAKLQQLAQHLKDTYSVETRYLSIDASSASQMTQNLERIKSLVADVPLRVLVNNVGVNTKFPTLFIDMTEEEIDSLIQVNVVFHTRITQALLPQLKKASGRCAIIDLSSISATLPGAPFLSVYAASKAYISIFSRTLHYELSSRNIDVIAISPAFVASSMSGFKKTSLMVTSPTQTARDTFSKLGKYAEVTPSWTHAIQRFVMSTAPASLVVSQTYNVMKTTREKLLQREQKTQ